MCCVLMRATCDVEFEINGAQAWCNDVLGQIRASLQFQVTLAIRDLGNERQFLTFHVKEANREIE